MAASPHAPRKAPSTGAPAHHSVGSDRGSVMATTEIGRWADAVGGPAGEPLTVLLVEDDPGDALLVEEMLAGSGVRVKLHHVTTLSAAVAALARRYDCVLLDLGLPDSVGLDGLRQVLRLAPDAAVMVLTGRVDDSAGNAALAAGAQDYLIKGQINGMALRRTVRYAVQRRQVEQAGRVLREARLRADENARLERGLLPRPVVSPPFGVLTRYRPGRERTLLGGDFYDVVQTDDHTLRLVVGDVSGHGPDEAAVGVLLRVAWRALVLAGVTASRSMTLLQGLLVAERPGEEMYATVCDVTVSLSARTITTVCAGHPPPVLVAHGRGRSLEVQPQVGLGLFADRREWTGSVTPLPARGHLLLYTDGLVDSHRGAGSLRWGVEGVEELAGRLHDRDATGLLDGLLGEVLAADAGRCDDDLAVLLLRWAVA